MRRASAEDRSYSSPSSPSGPAPPPGPPTPWPRPGPRPAVPSSRPRPTSRGDDRGHAGGPIRRRGQGARGPRRRAGDLRGREGVRRGHPGRGPAALGQARRRPRGPDGALKRTEGPLGREGPVRAGGRRGRRRQVRRGRGAGPRGGRGAPRRRPQGPPRRGLPRLRRSPPEAGPAHDPGRPRGGLRAARPGRGRWPRARPLRASLLLAMAQASQKAGNHGRAITDFQAYLGEYPKGADRPAARYGLGESQLAAGQALPARLTWTDLARDLEKVDTKEAADTPRPRPLRDRQDPRHPRPARRRRRWSWASPRSGGWSPRTRRTRSPSAPPTRSARPTSPAARPRRRSPR